MRARTFVFALVCGTATAALAQDGGYVRFPSASPQSCAMACASDQMCASWSFGTAARSYGQSKIRAQGNGQSGGQNDGQNTGQNTGMCAFSGSSVVRNSPGMVSGLPRRDSANTTVPMMSAPPQSSNQTFSAPAPRPMAQGSNGGTGWEVRPAPWLNNGGNAVRPRPQDTTLNQMQGAPQQLRPVPPMPSLTPSPAPRIEYESLPQSQPQSQPLLRPSLRPVPAQPVPSQPAPAQPAPAQPAPAQPAPIRAPVYIPPTYVPTPPPQAPVTIAPPRAQRTVAPVIMQAPPSRPLPIPAPPPGTRPVVGQGRAQVSGDVVGAPPAIVVAPQPSVGSTSLPSPTPNIAPRRPPTARGIPKNNVRPSPATTVAPASSASPAAGQEVQIQLPTRAPNVAAKPAPAAAPSRTANTRVAPPVAQVAARPVAPSTAQSSVAQSGAAPPRQETTPRLPPASGRGAPRAPVRDPSNPESFRGADGMIDAAEMRRAQLNAAREQGTPAYSVQREWEAVETERQRAAAAGEVRVDPLAGTSPVAPPPETRAQRRAREAEEAEQDDVAAPPRPPATRGARGVPRPKTPAQSSQNGQTQQTADAAPPPRARTRRPAPVQALDREPRLSGGPG